jgi:MOSC domain-containing protein YiiM
MSSLQELFDTLPQSGKVTWLGVRPERGAPMTIIDVVAVDCERGIIGDRYISRQGKRQVTLIQWEHLAVIASLLGIEEVAPELLRRNIAVAGINLLALKGKHFAIGNAVLEYTGLCHPCSQMEARFGPGGYNAVRGHGGITARVISAGIIRVGETVRVLEKN